MSIRRVASSLTLGAGFILGLIHTPPAVADPYRFVVLADSRDGPCLSAGAPTGRTVNEAALAQVFSSIAELEQAPSFVFFVGDLSCGFDKKSNVKQGFAQWQQVIFESGFPPNKVYPVFGGHERLHSERSAKPKQAWSAFKSYFDPAKQSRNAGGEAGMSCHYYERRHNPPGDKTNFSRTVYYCDFADDRFFVLNNDCIPPGHSAEGGSADSWGCVGHELGCGQLAWLREHLVSNAKRHNFFFHHEPAFGTGAHNISCPRPPQFVMDAKQSARNDFVRLLGYNNATATFSGHEHQYTWRDLDNDLVDRPINNPSSTLTSLAVLIEAAPVGQAAGPAVAYSYEGAKRIGKAAAPRLKLWWTSKTGEPDWTGRIDAGWNDAEELARNGGEPYLDSSDLELMRDQDLGEQTHVGLRWNNVPIPPGARILNARIEFTAKRDSGKGPKVKIRGEAASFSMPFSPCAKNLELRSQTRARKSWKIGPWKSGNRYQTKNLAKIFRELLEVHQVGGRFPGSFPEIKTGSSGAPWNENSCPAYMGNVLAQVITMADYTGNGIPYHYAVVDVNDDEVSYQVYSWDGTRLPPP